MEKSEADKKVLISVEMTVGQREKLKKLAHAHDRSYSYVLRKLAEQAIEAGDFLFLPKQKQTRLAGVKGGHPLAGDITK